MNLIKKIGKATAVGVLSLGLLYNGSVSKEDAIKEAERYGNLEIKQKTMNSSNMNLLWDTDKDGKNNLKAEYQTPFNVTLSNIKLLKMWEDKNKDGKFGEDEYTTKYNKEYDKLSLVCAANGEFVIFKDENRDNNADKMYVYRFIEHLVNPNGIKEYDFDSKYELIKISKDIDNNKKIEKNEVIWEVGGKK